MAFAFSGDTVKTENRLDAVFDPQRLSYVRNNMREEEVSEAKPDVGSGESGGMNDEIMGSDSEAGAQENKQKLLEPETPTPTPDNM
jgi:hypothetical protein